jgi:hypothetical protein
MRLFTFLVLVFSFTFSRSQDYTWATSDTTYHNSGGAYLASDLSGNFSAGITYTSSGQSSEAGVELIKYNSNNSILWKTKLKGKIYQGNLCFDASGNLYFAGGFRDTLRIGEHVFKSSCSGCFNMILLKFSSQGAFLWGRQSAGSDAWASNVSVDNRNNVYIAGYIKTHATFGSFTINSTGSYNYLAKYSSDGEFIWLQHFRVNCARGIGLKTDDSGNSYLSGTFFNWMQFDNLTLSSKGGYDIYYLKINSEGNLSWLRGAGGVYDDYGGYLDRDAIGNIFIAGNIGPDAVVGNYTLQTQSSEDYLIAKLDTGGNVNWTVNGWRKVNSFCADPSGNTYLSTYDKFMVKYDNNGALVWSQSKPTAHNISMVSAKNGNILTTGHFYFNVEFDNYSFNYGKSVFGYVHAAYIAKLSNNFTSAKEYLEEKSLSKIFPNPSSGKFTVTGFENEEATIKVYDSFGKLICSDKISERREIDLSSETSGIYLVELVSENRSEQKKIIIQ